MHTSPHAFHLAAILALAGAAHAQVATRTGKIVPIWQANCVSCHGENAAGKDGKAKSLLIDDYNDPALDRPYFDTVRNGRPGLDEHAFAGRLKDSEAWALVVYIRELQAGDWREKHGSPKPDAAGVYTSKHARFKLETVVAKGLTIPWAVDFLPDGRMLVTERSGKVRVHSTGLPGGVLSAPITGTPKVREKGQGGLMDVAVHPEYAKNGWIYLSFSDDYKFEGKSYGMTKIVRGKLASEGGAFTWTDQQTIFEAKTEHYSGTDFHFGSRFAFDPKDPSVLFFSVGERGRPDYAQNTSRPNGKIFRVKDDGTIPAENPFNTPEALASGAYGALWSIGHRNPQGLSFDLEGNLWTTEHGPRGGDELNLVLKGKNYGWPTLCFGMNYDGAPLATPWADVTAPDDPKVAAIQMPAYRWLPSIGACGLTVVKLPASGKGGFDAWKGDLIAGGLSGLNVDRIRVRDGKVVEREELIHPEVRIRAVKCGPDGSVYVVYNEPENAIVRLVPVR
jgi:glucose/arabinose dehydrogenase/cytochrome c553